MSELLAQLYAGAPVFAGVDPLRWRLERERRILDIQGQLWRYAPLAMPYGRALMHDAFTHRIMKGLVAATEACPTIYDAAIQSLHTVTAEAADDRLMMALAFDAARAGDMRYLRAPTALEDATLAVAGLGGSSLLDRPWKFGLFVASAQRLIAGHAPDEFLCNLELEPGRQIYAYRREAKKIRVADVTQALLGVMREC